MTVMTNEDVLFAGLVAQVALLDRGELSSETLVDLQISQVGQHNGKLNAFVHLGVDRVREQARAMDMLRRSGTVLGPLHGVPIAIKDLFDVQGMPTAGGSKSLPPRMASRSAGAVRKLEQAGAIIMGKTQTVEFAFGGWGTNAVMGTPWNPWNMTTHYVPGGSSSGSAVAVASGMVGGALGTDTGGSVRIPAGLCGLTGLKTSPGLVSRHGLMALCPTHDSVGPIARTAEDCALLFDVIAGPDPADPNTWSARHADTLAGLNRSIKGMRFWAFPEAEQGHASANQLQACLDTERLLTDLGMQAFHKPLPFSCETVMKIAGQLMSAEAYASLGEIVERDDLLFDPTIRRRILTGKTIMSATYLNLMAQRSALVIAMHEALATVDFLIFPTNAIAAIPVDMVDENSYPLSIFGRFVNLMDLCALAIPAGFDANGMPLSVQLIASKGREATILAVGHAIQANTQWHLKRPDGLRAPS